jgi:hypothetical protein
MFDPPSMNIEPEYQAVLASHETVWGTWIWCSYCVLVWQLKIMTFTININSVIIPVIFAEKRSVLLISITALEKEINEGGFLGWVRSIAFHNRYCCYFSGMDCLRYWRTSLSNMNTLKIGVACVCWIETTMFGSLAQRLGSLPDRKIRVCPGGMVDLTDTNDVVLLNSTRNPRRNQASIL